MQEEKLVEKETWILLTNTVAF